MLYSEKLKSFQAAHPCETITVCGAQCRYILSGENIGRTLVFLNGGMNTLEMWMDYVEGLSGDCRVLLFDYPQELRTIRSLLPECTPFFRSSALKIPFLWVRVTAVWSRRSMCRNIREKPADWS